MASLLGLLILGQTHRCRLCERTSRLAIRAGASGSREMGAVSGRQRPCDKTHMGLTETGRLWLGRPHRRRRGTFYRRPWAPSLWEFSSWVFCCLTFKQGVVGVSAAGCWTPSTVPKQKRRRTKERALSSASPPCSRGCRRALSPHTCLCSSEGGKQSRGHLSSTCWGSHIRAMGHWALQGAGNGLCVWGHPCPAEGRTRPRGSALQLCPGDGVGGQAVPLEVACPFPPSPWLLPSNPK